jgi:hypothetical protein
MRLLPLLLLLTLAATPALAQTEEEARVHSLVGASHGTTALSGRAVARALEEVRARPGPHIPLLLAYLDPERFSDPRASPELMREAQAAAALLVKACGEEGLKAAAERLARLAVSRDGWQERLSELERSVRDARELTEKQRAALQELRGRVDRHLRAETSLIQAFGGQREGLLRDHLLSRLERDSALHFTSLQYFEVTGRGDPRVEEALRKLMENPSARWLLPRLRLFFR